MNPIAVTARAIENIIITGKNHSNLLVKGGCALLSRTVSLVAFPILLTLQLVLIAVPKTILAIGNKENFSIQSARVLKIFLAILATPLSLIVPEVASTFFLQANAAVDKSTEIYSPSTEAELKLDFYKASVEGKQITARGAGTQAVLAGPNAMIIDMRHFKKIEIREGTVTVGAGVTWDELRSALNQRGMSVIEKSASGPGTIGGAIATNGLVKGAVTQLRILDADGNIRDLPPSHQLFGCMFDSFGYFGIIIEATLKIAPKEGKGAVTPDARLAPFKLYNGIWSKFWGGIQHSNLHVQRLQKYFIKPENLTEFLQFLGKTLKDNGVLLTNVSIIRPDGVEICFVQRQTQSAMARTESWMRLVNVHLASRGGLFSLANIPSACSREQFEACVGAAAAVAEFRGLKTRFDPHHHFENACTAHYYDLPNQKDIA